MLNSNKFLGMISAGILEEEFASLLKVDNKIVIINRGVKKRFLTHES